MARRPKPAPAPTYLEQATALSAELANAHLDGIANARTRAWDSALENADLTAKEEGLERWSEEWSYYLVSSFDPSMFEPSN